MEKVIAKINLTHIVNNAKYFKQATGVDLCAVVKADAYGHGAEEVAFALSSCVDLFAVAIVDEALKIRVSACGKGILILTPPVSEEETILAGQNGFILTIPDLYTARRVAEVCHKYSLSVKVHLKVNTGMNRYGANAQLLGKICKLLATCPWVSVEGIYSHLYAFDRQTCENQRKDFLRKLAVAKGYFPYLKSHLSATYGAFLGKDYAFDMVRIGLGLYGYLPTPELRAPLKKAMSVYAPVVATRKYIFGGVGYGNAPKDFSAKTLYTLRVGYADGFLRQKNNGMFGYETNANNLCMDACVRKGKATRGSWLPVMLDADITANSVGTISYEVLCSATKRAERIYCYDNENTNAKTRFTPTDETSSRGQ